ncbi:lipoprotein-releasing ABC transporter permease subunit [Massilia sp. erpn]|uniref:lipoprotein-releasing ABC transporter permease subunit n=1 Tax=Massilia sp. erpn TaxID=2738142 RepID=UPI00210296E2|nr:lipoprotein-releasing ABC transporter permease subunit [Massilia sp. erpn]UTY59801.1 lipoprotein-releasing ABC transporter permease subunit [Massilia sp. erpn]
MTMIRNLPYEWLVGLRYTRAGKRSSRNSFISFISLISMSGIALGVAALIIILSVMNGFRKDVTDHMLSVLAHVEVFSKDGSMPDWQEQARTLSKHPEVKGYAPFVQTQAMLLHGGSELRPAVVRGVLPEQEPNVSDLAGQVKLGSFNSLRPGEFNIVLGVDLARALHVTVGDKVTMALAKGTVTPAGLVPRMRSFTVAALFRAGHPEFDATLAFIHIEDAQRMLRIDAPAGLRLRLADMHRAPEVAQELQRMLPPSLTVRDWSQLNATWFGAVQIEKRMMFVVLTLVVAVAAFNLVSTLVMTVTDKQADIAILRTLGASPRSIMKIFVIQGALVGVLGALLGVSGGVLIATNIDVIVPFIEKLLGVQFLSSDIYYISTVPSDMHWPDVAVIGVVSVALAFLATIYPSWWAARVKPAEALRYE